MDEIKFQCKICGYIYDSTTGEPEGKIQPGTPFDKIPEKWVCPLCGNTKETFTEIKNTQ